jgi:transcriptional regulator with XRE-family HTH domain
MTRHDFSRAVEAHGGCRATAALLGCSTSMVSLLCSGKRRPGLALATKITEVLGIPATDWIKEAP